MVGFNMNLGEEIKKNLKLVTSLLLPNDLFFSLEHTLNLPSYV